MESRRIRAPFERRRRDSPWRVGAAIVLSLLLHLFFLGLFELVSRLSPPRRRPVQQQVTLRPLTDQEWASNRGEPPASTAAQPPKPKPKTPATTPKGQVVDVAPGNNEKPDDDAKYLATHNNKVQKQTRSRHQTAFYRNAMPQRTSPHPSKLAGQEHDEHQRVAGNLGQGNDHRPMHHASPQKGAMQLPDVKPRPEVALKEPTPGEGAGMTIPNQPHSDRLHGNSHRLKIAPGSPGQGSTEAPSLGQLGAPGLPNLLPSPSVMNELAGAAPNDDLHDVNEGDQTLLNTKEWKYASFFNRVKQAVGETWHPGDVLRARDPTGNVYGHHDRYTLLSVTLTDSGMVKEIHVEKSSGLAFLDLEAIHSFERAQPFPNPPPGLVATNRTVSFQFGFFLQMSGMPLIRMFRGGP